MSVLWVWWQSARVIVRSRVRRKQTQAVHGRVSARKGRGGCGTQWSAGPVQLRDRALCSQLCTASAAQNCKNPEEPGQPALLNLLRAGTWVDEVPFRLNSHRNLSTVLGCQGKTALDIIVWHKVGTHTRELKAYSELHLKEEQERGGKADQKWPLFFFLTIYVLSDLNYNMFNPTLILCELLWSGWTMLSFKVLGSMIRIIS